MVNKVYNLDMAVGLKTFRINFAEFDEAVDILFNPSDTDLPKRLFEAQKRIDDGIKERQTSFEIDENGLPKIDEYIESTNELNNLVFDSIDYAFGNKVSDKLFKHCSPFTITNGKLFIMQFVEKIIPVIEKIITDEQKKAAEHTNKHLAKYMKK